MFERKLDNFQQTVADKVLVQLGSTIRLQALCYCATLLNEQDGIFFALQILLFGAKYAEQLFQERKIRLQMLDDVDLVEKNERIENREGGIVENARQYDVFEVLQTVRRVDLSFYRFVLDFDHFLKFGLVGEILSMVCLMQWKVRVVCGSQYSGG